MSLLSSLTPSYNSETDWMCLRVHSDLNRLVLDYLFVEGYKSTAENFARESGGYDQCDLEGVDQRTAIRYAIHRGDIDAAIEQLNDLNSEVSYIFLHLMFPLFSTMIQSFTCTTLRKQPRIVSSDVKARFR